jgi:hypothetical protein
LGVDWWKKGTKMGYSPERAEEALRLKAQGLKYDEISKALGYKSSGSVSKLLTWYKYWQKLPEGQSLRGVSTYEDAKGAKITEWVKSKHSGRDPKESVKLPDPKTIVKLSTFYDQEGNVTAQWVAEKPEAKAQAEAWSEWAKELAKDLPRAEPIELTDGQRDNLLAVYPVGDIHLGMLAWDKEAGADYDLKIAEDLFIGAASYLSEKVKHCKQGLVLFLGDFMHYDGFVPETPTMKNKLDSDTRFPKMVRTAIRSMRFMIERAAALHETVHVIIEVGNHDISSSIFLMEAMRNIYENNERITIDSSPSHFHYHKYGKNLIGTHHGHSRVKLVDLPQIMAADRPGEWGSTKHRVWFTGHIHHDEVKDMRGCRVESVRVLAPEDAWARNSGYRASRGMKAIVIDEEYGEVSRHSVNPERLERNETSRTV